LKCFLYYRTLFYDEVGVKRIPTNIGELLIPNRISLLAL
jgi:hypothetical protein